MRVQTLTDFDQTSIVPAYGMALLAHFVLFTWNPTILTAGQLQVAPPPMMQVEYKEKLPELAKLLPPAPKPVEKKEPTHRAHKAGLNMKRAKPLPAVHRPVVVPTHRPRPVPIVLPKFTPHSSDEEALASASHPTLAAPADHPVAAPRVTTPHLKGRTRGVRASDIHFEMNDAGTLTDHGGGPVVSIPVGEEQSDQAMIGSAADLHTAPLSEKHHVKFQAQLQGQSYGELTGKNRSGYVAANIHMDGPSDDAVLAASQGGGHNKSITGNGFEIGGPIGDRKVLRRHLPEYPAWAEEKGISAIVKIYFTVRPDGSIRQSMRILRSSGYSDLDTLAKDALAAWKFSPTGATGSDEAWGVITFRFTLG